MTLSIIIVNYNVKYFLEQCLESVFNSDLLLEESVDGVSGPQNSETSKLPIDLEVYVVDNASVDGSVEMVAEKFPQVHLIANSDNPGFATANNQALRQCTGDLMLLLNPDTVVERDTFRKCVEFFNAHPDCGGLGVKMINGEGKFLKESKRGFPTPAASFYKISGLIRLFPHHPKIAAYYMGHLDEDETNPIDILPGAYLMISREALNKVGLLDESYFMYGEDIDFSWRIKLAGYQNYYLPSARIIHYKGESTKRGSMNYVYTFYNAMSIFVKRYFSDGNARLFNFLLNMAIWARASFSFVKRLIQAIALPVADFVIAFGGFIAIKYFWATYWAGEINYYPAEYTFVVIPLYILILMLVSWLYGGYEKPIKLSRIIKGMTVGSLILLIFYSLLNETQRYSRALLLLGCGWTLLSTLGIRELLSMLRVTGFDLRQHRSHTAIVIGSPEESERVKTLYSTLDDANIETIHDTGIDSHKLNDAINVYKADEIIFCSKDISIRQIIDTTTALSHLPGRRTQVDFKIVPGESDFVIGSNSISSAEDLYTEELHTIANPVTLRNKRLFDFFSALLMILLSPILFWFQKSKRTFYPHCWQVLIGQKSWVGTDGKSVFGPEHAIPHRASKLSPELKERLNLRYLRNYRLSTDIQIFIKNCFSI